VIVELEDSAFILVHGFQNSDEMCSKNFEFRLGRNMCTTRVEDEVSDT